MVEVDRCPWKGSWTVEQLIIERAAHYQSGQSVPMETAPAWQTQGVRAVLAWQAEEQQAERWASQARAAR